MYKRFMFLALVIALMAGAIAVIIKPAWAISTGFSQIDSASEITLSSDTDSSSDLIASGSCGVAPSTVKWSLYKNGSLMITGSGKMINYEIGLYREDDSIPGKAPWKSYSSTTPIKELLIGAEIQSIGANAFSGCDMLELVSFFGGSGSVEEIGKKAFYGCTALREITIPGRIKSVGESAFAGCVALTDLYYESYGSTWFKAVKENSIPTTTNIHFKDNLYEKDYLRQNDYKATWELTMDGILTITGTGKIEDYSEKGPWCEIPQVSVKKAQIGDGITGIGRNAFSNCAELSEIVFPTTVTVIEPYAFRGCTGLTSIAIPKSVTFIGGGAFSNCESLCNIHYGGTESDWNILDIGAENECLSSATIHYADYPPFGSGSCGKNLTWVLDSNGILTIRGTGAMKDYSPQHENGEEIAPWRSNLQSKILEITVEEGVTSIGSYAFYYCQNCSITLPSSISSIGKCAFSCCDALTDVYYGGEIAEWQRINISQGNSWLTSKSIHYECGTFSGSILPDGAVVQMIGQNGATYNTSATGGQYVFRNIPHGTYMIYFEKNGYVSYKKQFTFSGNDIIPFVCLVVQGNINGTSSELDDVDVTDLACLYELLSTNRYSGTITDEEYLNAVSDINNDGRIDVYDLQRLYEAVCGIWAFN